MKTIVITKVYEVRESNKGWSATYEMFFNKEKALETAKKMQEIAQQEGGRINHYAVYEHTCGDAIIYTEE